MKRGKGRREEKSDCDFVSCFDHNDFTKLMITRLIIFAHSVASNAVVVSLTSQL